MPLTIALIERLIDQAGTCTGGEVRRTVWVRVAASDHAQADDVRLKHPVVLAVRGVDDLVRAVGLTSSTRALMRTATVPIFTAVKARHHVVWAGRRRWW